MVAVRSHLRPAEEKRAAAAAGTYRYGVLDQNCATYAISVVHEAGYGSPTVMETPLPGNYLNTPILQEVLRGAANGMVWVPK